MQLRFAFIAAAAVIAVSDTASANVISTTQSLSISTGSLGEYSVNLQLPDFNNSLGTLTGFSLQFTGTVQDQVLFEMGAPEGGTFTAANNAGLGSGGFGATTYYSLSNGSFMFDAGAKSAISTTTDVAFSANLPAAALSQYTTGLPPGYETAMLDFGFHLIDASGHIVNASDAETKFIGQYTETYTYTPVPEPGTILLVMTAVMTVGALRHRRQSR